MNTKYKILHLEDVKTDAELAARELKKSNILFEQYVVDNEEEYKQALDHFSPDLILCDHSLSSFNSSEALRIFKEKKLNIPFILITATLSDEVAISVLKNGAADYILKDRLKRLPNAVINAIEKCRLERESKQLRIAKQEQEDLSNELLAQFSNKLVLATSIASIGILEYLFCENRLIADDILLSQYALTSIDFKGSYKELEQYVHPDDKARIMDEFRIALLTGSRLNTEYRITWRDGSVHYIKVVALIQYNSAKAPLRLIGTSQDITFSKEAEQLVRQSEGRLAEAQAVAKVGSWETDLSDLKLIWSDETYRIFGIARKQINLFHADFLKLVHADDLAEVDAAFMGSFNNPSVNSIEHRIVTPAGIIKHVEERWRICHDDQARPIRVIGTCQDITERTKAKDEQESERRDYEALINSTDDRIWSVSRDFKLIAANKAFIKDFEAMAGFTIKPGDDLLTKDVFSEEYLMFWEGCYTKVLSGESLKKEVYTQALNNWPEAWSDISFNPIYKAETIVAIACFSRNITEKKQAEQNNKFKAKLLNTIGQAVMATDLDGIVSFWNKAAERIYGWTKEEVIGRNITDLTPTQQTKEQAAEIMKELSKGNSWSGEFMVKRKDGRTFPVFVTDAPIYDQYKNLSGIIGVSSDITERKLSEIRLYELNENLQRQAKKLAISNAELEQFAYVASHDLQEPLRMVTSFLKLLEQKYKNIIDDKGKQYIGFAVDGAVRMHRIILDLLEYSRVGKTKDSKETLDLNKLVKDIQMQFQEQIEEKSAVIRIGELPVIYANKTQISQVFQNLISNALKYSKEGLPCQIHISAKESANHWKFTVSDNGIGIAKEYFDRIFVVFQRLHNKDEFSGTGIGLAIIKKTIESLGGKIWVDSKEGKGSDFYFTLQKVIRPLLLELNTHFIKTENECLRLNYSLDWSKHLLGMPAYWPQSLTSTLSIIFNSKFPMFLFWGADYTCFYNDAYRPSMGNNGKHPGAMGKKGKEVWPEIWDFIHPELEQVMTGGEATWHENQFLPIFRNNQMEDVYWTYSYSPVIGESGKVAGVLVTCNETTAQVTSEKRLIDLTMQLEAKARALTKSNHDLEHFAAVASHDLNEPLRMVIGFIELLKIKFDQQLDEKANSYINFALDGGKRMQRMMSDLLDLSRTGGNAGVKQLTNLNETVKEVNENILKLIEDTQAKIIVKTAFPVLEVYKTDISRLLQNLLCNAIKFRKKKLVPVILLTAVEKEDEWLFSIEDNGIGIDQERSGDIFEIFARLHSPKTYDGTGIGLAVCKKVVEQHGGKIWVESEKGKGSIFYFTLLKPQ